MGYTKETKEVMNQIPKEYHEQVQKIMRQFYKYGVDDAKALITAINDIPSSKINEYCVLHESGIDGG